MMHPPIKKSPSGPALLYLLFPFGGADAMHPETMRRRASFLLFSVLLSLFLFASFSLYTSRNPIYVFDIASYPPANLATQPPKLIDFPFNSAIEEDIAHRTCHASSIQDSSFANSVSVLLPDWEVLVIVSPETERKTVLRGSFSCLYPNNATSPARFSGILPLTSQSTFKCSLPWSARRRFPFLAPRLTRSTDNNVSPAPVPREMLRWSFLVYESLSTENDVVLLVKGVNKRQGINRSPQELRCLFLDEDNNNAVRTAVTSSVQEVFRCQHPNLKAFGSGGVDPIRLKISLEMVNGRSVATVPSVAYYAPRSSIAGPKPKSQLCACTMVYDVAKFLKEWIMYHSKIGVERFILYNNDSDDELNDVVNELNANGYNVETLLWFWPKTQEAGFSHAASYAKDSCTWMLYVDVDEFVFAPLWTNHNSSQPSDHDHVLLRSVLPKSDHGRHRIGQVSIWCNEFGPSNQRAHPLEGVTQGYTCRREVENRHKSMVLLAAIDDSLHNAIHHFTLKKNYKWKQLSLEAAVVNHYKYQAWPEFKAKFRRRVSAYVVDWRQAVNPLSKDRTPGLGFEAVEPPGWEKKFCEVRDDRLKLLVQRWFGKETVRGGYKLAWQR